MTRQIHTIKPDTYTTRPDRSFYGVPANGSGWFQNNGHFYKTKNGGDDAKLITTDNVEFNSNYDSDHNSTNASGNPCSSSGFDYQFSTNTNTPGYSVAVIASGSRSNLKSWGSSSIGSNDKSNCMKNVVGCTFQSDNGGSSVDNKPYIYVHKMAFIYRDGNNRAKIYSLSNELSGLTRFNTAHHRTQIYQGGYIDYSKISSSYTFHGIVVEYWSSKNAGTTPRLFNHKIKYLKFIVGKERSRPTDQDLSGYDPIVLQSGSNTHTGNTKLIWTS